MEHYVTNPILEPLIAAHQRADKAYKKEYYGQFLPAWPEKYRDRQFSLSTLQRSPQQAYLTWKHSKELRVNAACAHWSLFGSVIHEMLEEYPWGIKERRYGLILKDLDVLVHHKSDLILPEENRYLDYKNVSEGSLKFDKTHWEEQLNFGVWLAEGRGWYLEDGKLRRSPEIQIDHIHVVANILDWRPSDPSSQYPEGSTVIDIPKWEPERVEAWVRERAELHLRARQGDVPDCTAEERWQRGGWKPYAYTKAGALSKMAATSELFPSEEAALSWAREQGKKVEVRYVGGRNLNCDFYCQVREKCPQYQAMNQGEL